MKPGDRDRLNQLTHLKVTLLFTYYLLTELHVTFLQLSDHFLAGSLVRPCRSQGGIWRHGRANIGWNGT